MSHGTARKTQRRLRRLVIGQIAIALVLVSVAMQLSNTYRQMLAGSRALLAENAITAAVAVKGPSYENGARLVLWDRFIAATESLPGVSDAAVTTKLPFEGGVSTTVLTDDESYDPAQPREWTEVSYVSPHFFPAIGAALVRGRFLTGSDYAERRRAVVINRAMADRFWPGQDPIGQRIRPAQAGTSWAAEVVGVVENVRQSAERPARAEMYFPYADHPQPEAFLVLRTAAGFPVPLDQVREELRRLDPDLALAEVTSMQSHFANAGSVITVVTAIVDALTIAILALASTS